MSLSITQLLEVLAQHKATDLATGNAVIADEIANGLLLFKQQRLLASQRRYDSAIQYLEEEPPNILHARDELAGAQHIDRERGVGTSGTDALAALAEFEATVITGAAAITQSPEVVEGEGDVV